jgi:hypothetical protein
VNGYKLSKGHIIKAKEIMVGTIFKGPWVTKSDTNHYFSACGYSKS